MTGKVKPGYTTTKIVKVTVPYEAEATEEGKPGVRVSITVESQFDPSQQDGRGTYIRILQFWAVTFNVDKVNDTTRPGERVDFTFVVRNDGNGADNITLSMEHNLEGLSLSPVPAHRLRLSCAGNSRPVLADQRCQTARSSVPRRVARL